MNTALNDMRGLVYYRKHCIVKLEYPIISVQEIRFFYGFRRWSRSREHLARSFTDRKICEGRNRGVKASPALQGQAIFDYQQSFQAPNISYDRAGCGEGRDSIGFGLDSKARLFKGAGLWSPISSGWRC